MQEVRYNTDLQRSKSTTTRSTALSSLPKAGNKLSVNLSKGQGNRRLNESEVLSKPQMKNIKEGEPFEEALYTLNILSKPKESIGNESPISQSDISSLGKQKLYQVFLSCLPNDTSKYQLLELFSSKGPIKEIILWTRGLQSTSTYAVIKTHSSELNEFLLNSELKVNGSEIFSRVYFSKEQKSLYLKDMSERRLKLSGIPTELSDGQLIQIIKSAFRTEKAYTIRGEDGSSEGTGFVLFAEKGEAIRALKMMEEHSYLLFDFSKVRKAGETNEEVRSLIESGQLEQMKDSLRLRVEKCVDKQSRVQGLMFKDIDKSMELKTLKNVEIVKKYKMLREKNRKKKASIVAPSPGAISCPVQSMKDSSYQNFASPGGKPLLTPDQPCFKKDKRSDPEKRSKFRKRKHKKRVKRVKKDFKNNTINPSIFEENSLFPLELKQNQESNNFYEIPHMFNFNEDKQASFKKYPNPIKESIDKANTEQIYQANNMGLEESYNQWGQRSLAHHEGSEMERHSSIFAQSPISDFNKYYQPQRKPNRRIMKNENPINPFKPRVSLSYKHRNTKSAIISLSGMVGQSHSNQANVRFNNPIPNSIINNSLVWNPGRSNGSFRRTEASSRLPLHHTEYQLESNHHYYY